MLHLKWLRGKMQVKMCVNVPFVAVQIIDGRFKLYGLDHLSCPQGIKIHTTIRGTCPAKHRQNSDWLVEMVLILNHFIYVFTYL